jgi:hypothetical protein
MLKFKKTYNTSWSIFYWLFTFNTYGLIQLPSYRLKGGFLKQRRLKARLLWDKEPVLVLKSFSGTESF